MHFDDILKQYLGEFGRYQKIQYVLVCLPTIFTAMHALSWTFNGAKMGHRCLYPGEEPNATYKYENGSWLWSAQNRPELTQYKDGKTCKRLVGVGYNTTLSEDPPSYGTEGCGNGYVWDYTMMELSAVKYWELTCDYAWIRAFVQSMYYIGQCFWLADSWSIIRQNWT